MTFQKQLQNLEACKEAREWVGEKTFEEAWTTCPRGDWLLWLAAYTVDRKLVVKAVCAVKAPAKGKVSLEAVKKARREATYAATGATYAAATYAYASAAYASDAVARGQSLRASADIVRAIVKVEDIKL